MPTILQVRQALMNLAPATPSDLLAYIENHLTELSFELTRTQRERYRAYWNERGRDVLEPKREVVCSGLLAEDLQNRVRLHGLIVTVEHHMVDNKECDLVVLQGLDCYRLKSSTSVTPIYGRHGTLSCRNYIRGMPAREDWVSTWCFGPAMLAIAGSPSHPIACRSLRHPRNSKRHCNH